jgi:DNA polymerase-3 subunit alpha
MRVAGLVTRSRQHQTKTGKSMGFVTIEDVQGVIELVLFPRTWERFRALLENEHIVIVDGKVDNENGDPKVLVDSVTTELTTYESVPAAPPPDAHSRPKSPPPGTRNAGPAQQPHQVREATPKPSSAPQTRSTPASDENTPPPPDTFAPDWDIQEIVPNGFVLESQRSETPSPAAETNPEQVIDLPAKKMAVEDTQPAQAAEAALPQAVVSIAAAPPPISEKPPVPEPLVPATELPHFVGPALPVQGVDLHLITVILRPSQDKARDNLRLRQIYGTLISYPGQDRFALIVYERGRGYQIEFPNFTTGLNNELLARLQHLAGAENVRVEILTFQ